MHREGLARELESADAIERSLLELVGKWPRNSDGISTCPEDERQLLHGIMSQIEKWSNGIVRLLRGGVFENFYFEELKSNLQTLYRTVGTGSFREAEAVRVSAFFARARHMLGVIPTEVLADEGRAGQASIIVKPNTAFILMWMDSSHAELQDVAETLRSTFEAFGIIAKRADDFEHQDVITELILGQIASAEFLIADLTGERPNVYYEVGFAHGIGKRPILYRRAGTRLHFDLSVHNVPEYKNLTELKQLLMGRLTSMTGRTPRSGTR
jgi:hypothetical protein